MSVSFHGLGYTLDVNIGLADRLLTAIGYKTNEYTHGSMPLAEAKMALETAKATLPEDEEYFKHLRKLVNELSEQGFNVLEWT